MRNQYLLLAEKYDLVKEAAIDPFNSDDFTKTAQVVIQVLVHVKNMWLDFINRSAQDIELDDQGFRDKIWNNFITSKISQLNNYLFSTTRDSSKNFAGVALGRLPENHIAGFATLPYDSNNASDENYVAPVAIVLNVDYLSRVAFTRTPEEQKSVIDSVTNSLYHEYIHFIQHQKHLARDPRSLVNKLKNTNNNRNATISNAEYYNSKQEIMTQASDAANFFLRKYGNVNDAINALTKFGDRYTKEMELTPDNKKRFYRYTVDYINKQGTR